MDELQELIEILFKNIKDSPSIEYLRNNYNSLKKLQEFIKYDKIIPKMENISKQNI